MRIATALHRVAIAAFTVLLALSGQLPAALAVPATPEISAKQAEAASAQAELERINIALEVQIEEYNAISEALEQTREEIRKAHEEMERAKADLAESRGKLSGRARAIYKDGGSGLLEVFLGARTFDDFMMRLDLARRINRSDAEIVVQVKEAKARVESTQRILEQRQAEQVALRAEAGSRAELIEADLAAQQRFVNQLTAEVRTLIAEEEERQRRLAEERARLAALAAAAAQRAATTPTRTATDPSQLRAGHPEVVQIALGFIGVPYLWGGSTPSGFDCSGLTQYCYRQIEVTIPRTSQSQFNAGQHIARDRLDLLQPGDLVFFGTDGDSSRVHHVGMYVGDSNFVHAPYTGAFVRVDSLTGRISSRGDYVGASRY